MDIKNIGVLSALGAAFLFGVSTPLAKLLLSDINPWLLAALLYLGSGVGLSIYRFLTKASPVHLAKDEIPWLIGTIVSGGVIAPVLLMLGLSHLPATNVSLLLNMEAVLTAVLAWCVFKENVDKRIFIGMISIVVGALILSWSGDFSFSHASASWLVLAACLAWAIDNNLTRKVSLTDATWIASIKGLSAGIVNLLLAMSVKTTFPTMLNSIGAMLVGFFAYGISLTLFVIGLRHLGTARTGAYFSIAPFIGALIAVVLGEPITLSLLIAGALMAFGVWLHLTEKHEHLHTHQELYHDHEHIHDEHHQHDHDYPVAEGVRHRHFHKHEVLQHTHAHYPDIHHQHDHK
ncbi:DMT family transporter [Acinetobacter sp. MB5]|uniref:DMT family transporter n=1 Tax=Acinetobacter sp. MB5 TaxID=2069438 RepID=UPI000DD0D126|nr:DMT family transporter [Acinetobacter sp. MB5]